jgi:hypothetical protein
MGGYCEFGTEKVVDVTVVSILIHADTSGRNNRNEFRTRQQDIRAENEKLGPLEQERCVLIIEYRRFRGSSTSPNSMTRRTSVFVT